MTTNDSKSAVLAISTSTIAQCGERVLNITVKSSNGSLGTILAPSWELVGGHKRFRNPDDKRWKDHSPLNDEQYTDMYIKLLQDRYRKEVKASASEKRENRFHTIAQMGAVTLACYCADGDFCHRHIAVDVISKIAKSLGIEVIELGEVTQIDADKAFATI
jgi:uncharacterized protein YeaO (DUF488 family)